jgi:hypothetical protein
MKLTLRRLKEVLSYDPLTGLFIWRPRLQLRHTAKDGCAGSPTSHGYRYICIDGRKHKASKLAWLWVYGCWPEKVLDHINGKRADDRIQNLREATYAENNQNCGNYKNNTSGLRGVRPDYHGRQGRKWRAQITVKGRRRHLGVFATKEEASQAYLAARASAFTFQPVPRES